MPFSQPSAIELLVAQWAEWGYPVDEFWPRYLTDPLVHALAEHLANSQAYIKTLEDYARHDDWDSLIEAMEELADVRFSEPPADA